MTKTLVLDKDVSGSLIRQRKMLRLDRYDEVWDGVYVMPSVPSLHHQELVLDLGGVYKEAVRRQGGKVYPGANVTDRRKNWKESYRVPDVVVVLKQSRAKKRRTHIFWGPDFLTEIQSPDEDPEEKLPFYSKIQVQEVLMIHRDTRNLTLLRHDGQELVRVEPTLFQDHHRLVSQVIPLAFRKVMVQNKPRTEIIRLDGISQRWLV